MTCHLAVDSHWLSCRGGNGKVFIRCGSRKAVWCVDNLVVWGCMFLFVFKLHNLPYWRLPCALFVLFLMISKLAFGQGIYVCSSSLSVGCQIWECFFPPSINLFPTFLVSFVPVWSEILLRK